MFDSIVFKNYTYIIQMEKRHGNLRHYTSNPFETWRVIHTEISELQRASVSMQVRLLPVTLVPHMEAPVWISDAPLPNQLPETILGKTVDRSNILFPTSHLGNLGIIQIPGFGLHQPKIRQPFANWTSR